MNDSEDSHILTLDDCNVIRGLLFTANGEYYKKFDQAVQRILRNEQLRKDIIMIRDKTEACSPTDDTLINIIQVTEDLK